MGQQGSSFQNNNAIPPNYDVEIPEQAGINFFYGSKKNAEEVKGVEN